MVQFHLRQPYPHELPCDIYIITSHLTNKHGKMSEYYESDLADPEREIIRPRSKKRHDPFSDCKWAAGEWEARYYAWTPVHREQCAKHIKQLVNNPAWFKNKGNEDARAIIRNNKARGAKPKPKKAA